MTTITNNVISHPIKTESTTHRSSHCKTHFKRECSHLHSHQSKDKNPKNVFDLIEEELEPSPLSVAPPLLQITPLEASTTSAQIVSAPLPTDIEALFEKMAGSMIVLSSSQESETSLFLDSPQFSSSVFYGTKITIKEFATAPKAFNVEISSSPLALMRIEMHKASLLEAFQKGDFNFSIGRFDLNLQDDDRPSFARKDPVSNEEEDESQ